MFAMTRSGSRLRIFSRSGFFSPPMRVLPLTTARGSTQYTVIPASASASPSAQSVSVMLGTSETIRRGGLASSTATPDASTLASIWRPRAVGLRVQIERRRLFPQGLALGLEVPGVHEVQAVMQVHLELAAAVSAADPARGILEERLHLARGQPNEPLEADRSRPRLLNADGRGEIGPHAAELFEDLPAARALDALVGEIALEVRLDEVPAPRSNHCGAQCIMASCG